MSEKYLNSESVISSPTVVNEKLTTSTPRKDSEEIPKENGTEINTSPRLSVEKVSEMVLKSEDINELEAEWQYQLPSPPKAFRDSSPTSFTDMTNYDTITFNGLTVGSVVTPPPPLFDKDIRDNHSENETISEVDSESKVLTSKYLSLETLEKRKALVLERELTSLKVAQNENKKDDTTLRNQKNNLINEVEEVIQNRSSRSASLTTTNSQPKEKILQSDSTLPNFKITTYDQPKSKINIFEDDTIRSSVDKKYPDKQKRNSVADINVCFKPKNFESAETYLAHKRNSLGSSSIENLNYMKRMNSNDDDVFKKPQEVPKFNKFNSLAKKNMSNGESVTRSESFSQVNGWSKSNPVKRSKSQVSLGRYNKEENVNEEENLQKSNSMWNVSGLQSLEVRICPYKYFPLSFLNTL